MKTETREGYTMKNKNEGKHTPGPWSVVKDRFNNSQVYAENRNILDDLPIADNIIENTNAILIAAAPELLDIVKRMNWAFYVDGTPKALRAVMSESKALISKTEGME